MAEGKPSPVGAQPVVRETLNYASERGGQDWLLAPIAPPLPSARQPPSPLFHLLPYSLTDGRGHLDEVSQEVSVAAAAAGLIDTAGRVPLSPLFCTISQNWGKCHSPALSSDREEVAGGWFLSPRAMMYA